MLWFIIFICLCFKAQIHFAVRLRLHSYCLKQPDYLIYHFIYRKKCICCEQSEVLLNTSWKSQANYHKHKWSTRALLCRFTVSVWVSCGMLLYCLFIYIPLFVCTYYLTLRTKHDRNVEKLWSSICCGEDCTDLLRSF